MPYEHRQHPKILDTLAPEQMRIRALEDRVGVTGWDFGRGWRRNHAGIIDRPATGYVACDWIIYPLRNQTTAGGSLRHHWGPDASNTLGHPSKGP
jgi:hypothetical protein